MSTIESTNAAAPSGEVRYLQPIAIDTNNKKKYCRFKKYGIKHIDHKDPEFLLTGTSLKYQRKLSQAVKRARHLGLMPYVADNLK
jgi:small subunit ribosomal protein S18